MSGRSPSISSVASRLTLAILVLAAPAAAAGQVAPAERADDAPETTTFVSAPAKFFIAAFDVIGATKLAAADIEKAVYPYMGPDRTSTDVEAARKALQDAYAKRGYEASVVEVVPQPQEEFALGLIQIRVNEAPVGVVKVTGARYHSTERVRKQVASLKPGEPVDFKAFQNELAAANRYPDREIIPAFDAGETPGTIDVDLKVQDSFPLHSTITLNNDNSPNTTSLRLSGSTRYTDLWRVGHTISAGFSIAPKARSESSAIFFSYTAPILGSPWTLVASGYKSNSDIAALGGTNVLGNGYQLGFQAIYRVPSVKHFHAFRAGLDYKNFKQDINLGGINVSRTPIEYMPLVLGYSFGMSDERTSLDIDLSSTLGLRVFKRVRCFDLTAPVCRPEDQFTNKDVDSVENFAHVNLDVTYTAGFKGDWGAELKLSGQYADSHLVANEQFAIGGLTSVRGYFQSEVVGDRGFLTSLELRAPSLATAIGSFVDELRVFGFAEGGHVSVIDPLPDTRSTFRIGSVGAGVRLKVFKTLTGEFLVGVPLIATTESQRGDPRYTFSLKGEF